MPTDGRKSVVLLWDFVSEWFGSYHGNQKGIMHGTQWAESQTGRKAWTVEIQPECFTFVYALHTLLKVSASQTATLYRTLITRLKGLCLFHLLIMLHVIWDWFDCCALCRAEIKHFYTHFSECVYLLNKNKRVGNTKFLTYIVHYILSIVSREKKQKFTSSWTYIKILILLLGYYLLVCYRHNY